MKKLTIFILIILSSSIYAQQTIYDGRTKLTILSDKVAEFTSQRGVFTRTVSSMDGSAIITYSTPLMKVWKVKNIHIKRSLQYGVLPQKFKKNFSPILRDGSGVIRALPGNVIIFMNQSWSKEKVYAWAKQEGLTIISQLSTSQNIYIVESPIGLQSLYLAIKLREKTGVIKAIPNWWRKGFRR